jgi:hypothetical protein
VDGRRLLVRVVEAGAAKESTEETHGLKVRSAS